jgi:ABC-type multidrug transport system fused ATPase/permease subunit
MASEATAPKPPKIPLSDTIAGDIRYGLIGTWLIALINACFLILIGRALDNLLGGEPLVGPLLFILAVFLAGRGLVNWAVPAKGARAQGRLETVLRDRVYRNVMRQGAVVRSQEQTGRLVGTGTTSVELAATYYATFLGPIIAAMTTPLVVLIVVAIAISWQIAVVLLGFVILIPLAVGVFQRAVQKVSDDYTRKTMELSAEYLDAIQGLPTLSLFNRGRAHGEKLAQASEAVRRAIMRMLLGNQLVLLVVDVAFSLGMITVTAYLAMTRLQDGSISPGEAMALVLLGLLLIEPLDKLGQFFYIGMSGMASAKDIRALLRTPPAVPDDAGATVPPGDGDGSLEFDRVGFNYEPNVPVLQEVSFSVGRGEKVALVGPSGSGKTTVSSLVMRFLAPKSGTIRVGGVDVASVTGDWVRSQISLVAQSTFLFNGTLRDNLLVADPDADDARLRAALSDADLADFLAALPQGLDTQVGERGLAVSGGQAQRIAIARAFLKDSPILVLDEPTSNIDAESEAAIVASIDRLAVGRTVLVIAHRLSTVRHVDRVVVLDGGRVTESGTHDELMRSGGHYARAIERMQGAMA